MHDALALGLLIARVQGAEFDADAVIALRTTTGLGGARQRGDGLGVALQIAQRIGLGAGAFAQHVIGKAQTGLLRTGVLRMVHGLAYGLAEHKLAAQELHRPQGCGHHRMRTQAAHQPGTRCGLLGVGQEMLGQGDRRTRQTGQHLVTGLVKVGTAELVGGQGDGGVPIRHAQQGLGQAHQGQAFGAGDRVLAQQTLHGPQWRGLGAHGLYPGCGNLGGSGPVQLALQALQALGNHLRFCLVRGWQNLVWVHSGNS